MALTPWNLPAEEDPQLVTARARLGTVLGWVVAGWRRRGHVDTPLTPMQVSALAELAIEVCCRQGLPPELYALAVAYSATLPRKLADHRKVTRAYQLRLLDNPSMDDAAKSKMRRQIVAELAEPEKRLPGRPLDPRTRAEAALCLGGFSKRQIALLTDPDREPWREGEGARRVTLRLARYREWWGPQYGPPACVFSKVNARNSTSRRSNRR